MNSSADMVVEPGFSNSAVPIDGSMDDGFAGMKSSTDGAKQDVPTGMCACVSMAYYRPYFNVHTSDVAERLRGTLAFYQSEPTFLSIIGDTPDAYGPFWVATTLIFTISVTSNLARTLQSGYTYDFEVRQAALPLLTV